MKNFKTPFPELKSVTAKISNLKLKKKNNKSLKYCMKVIVGVLAVFGVLGLIGIYSFLNMLTGQQKMSVVNIPENAIVSIDFNTSLPEVQNDGLFAEMRDNSLTYFDFIKTLNIALLDKNVKALVANINVTGLGLSQIQEIRQILNNYKKAGKKTYIFSSGMGSLGGGTDEYYLATAFDEIYMQPNSDLGITGVDIEIPFFKDTLNKIGLETEFYTRHEYKTAVASLTDNHLTPQNKQQMEYIGKTIYGIMRHDIAAARELTIEQVDKLINQAPLSAETALKNKLIDGISYYSDLKDQIQKEVKGKIIKFTDYAANYIQKDNGLPAIAYLTLEGTIVEGETEDSALSGELTIGADTIVKNIRAIAKNKNIKAVLVRLNSPGGSYTASQIIWHELNKLKEEKHLPLVISMGDYAASGGYFIALAGDKLIAEPLTLTGSIGVLGGKFVTAGLAQKLGVHWGTVKIGENAGILSSNHKFSASEKAAFNRSLDNIYQDFTKRVSESRHIDLKALDKLARGRVWLGINAVQNGLIDGLGNIDVALLEAKNLAGITPEQKFDIINYPKPKTFAEKLNDFFRRSPQITINQLASKIGLDIQDINVLQHLQYDCIMLPFVIYK